MIENKFIIKIVLHMKICNVISLESCYVKDGLKREIKPQENTTFSRFSEILNSRSSSLKSISSSEFIYKI